jgi:hypothetical protein
MKITHNEHPSQPAQDDCFGASFPDDLWNLVIQCWDPDPATRPGVAHIIHEMNRISRMNLPATLFIEGSSITNVEGKPVAYGNVSDIHRGMWEGKAVAIKVYRRNKPNIGTKDYNVTKQLESD